MKRKLLVPLTLLIMSCVISSAVHAQGFGTEDDPGGNLPPVVVTPPPPPPPPDPPPSIPPPDPCQLNPCSCNPQSCGAPPENPCVTNPCSCSPACSAPPPPPTVPPLPINMYGNHHLDTGRLPKVGVDAQIAGYCAYQTIANILLYYGVTLSTAVIAQTCMNQNSSSAELNSFSGTDQSLLNLVDAFLTTMPSPPMFGNSITGAIDQGDPVMAYIAVAGQDAFHEVMITGYNNDGSYVYFDPQTTSYVTAPAGTVFNDPLIISGVR